MKFSNNREWLKKKAEAEDGCFVSVGGLITRLGQAEGVAAAKPTRSAFVRLLQLARRERGLSWEQFAVKVGVPLEELVTVELDESFIPKPRTVFNLARFLRISEKKLMALSGLLIPKDAAFNEEAVLFAARSESVEKLSPEEHRALEEYIRFLSEQ